MDVPLVNSICPEYNTPSWTTWLRIQIENLGTGTVTSGKADTLDTIKSDKKYKSRDVRDNRACTKNMSINPEEYVGKYGGQPWRKPGYKYQEGILGLHEEIMHCAAWLEPTYAEHYVRTKVVARVHDIIMRLWPGAQVQVFGSFRTGLYLPTADIDIVVIGNWDTLPLRTLEAAVLAQGIAEADSVKVLDKASVPIVKLTDKEFDIKVDISFNMSNGIRSAELIKEFKNKYECLSKLVFVLKQFLLERDLNEVFTGGISSYSLILMVISFLQLHPRDIKTELQSDFVNLGILLIEFFELYGKRFNYMQTAIRIKDGGAYIRKEDIKKDMKDGHRSSILCIEDPLTPGNDIGKSSYGAFEVARAFKHAYMQLTHYVNPFNRNLTESILGRIIHVTDEVIDYRRWLAAKLYSELNLIPTDALLYTQQQYIIPDVRPVTSNCSSRASPAPIHVYMPPYVDGWNAVPVAANVVESGKTSPLTSSEDANSLSDDEGANDDFDEDDDVVIISGDDDDEYVMEPSYYSNAQMDRVDEAGNPKRLNVEFPLQREPKERRTSQSQQTTSQSKEPKELKDDNTKPKSASRYQQLNSPVSSSSSKSTSHNNLAPSSSARVFAAAIAGLNKYNVIDRHFAARSNQLTHVSSSSSDSVNDDASKSDDISAKKNRNARHSHAPRADYARNYNSRERELNSNSSSNNSRGYVEKNAIQRGGGLIGMNHHHHHMNYPGNLRVENNANVNQMNNKNRYEYNKMADKNRNNNNGAMNSMNGGKGAKFDETRTRVNHPHQSSNFGSLTKRKRNSYS